MRDAGNLPFRLAHRGDNLIGGLLIFDFDVFALVLEELGFEERRLTSIEHGVDRPVFLRDERADFLFALDDQAKRDRLHTSCGKAAADFVPEKRRNLVAHDAVENAAGLLGIDQVRIHFAADARTPRESLWA